MRVNFIINTPEPVIYKSIETKTDTQNAEFYLREASRIIEELDAQKVLGVISDNASVCQRFWRLLESKYAEDFITAYGCAAHVLNLIVKDICTQSVMSDLLKKCSALVKEIKQSHLLLAKFNEIQNAVEGKAKVTTTLKFPGATRWGSQLYCLESIQKN